MTKGCIILEGKKVHLEKTVGCKKQISQKKTEVKYIDSKNA